MANSIDAEFEYIPVRALNELAYCPRLYHLVYVQSLFVDNPDVIEGNFQHGRSKRNQNAAKEAADPIWPPSQIDNFVLSSDELGIIGKFDCLQIENGELVPIEDKHGKAPDGEGIFTLWGESLLADAWANDQVQLIAQIMLLRANGYSCERGEIYYREDKKKIQVEFSHIFMRLLSTGVKFAREVAAREMPVPLLDSRKCLRCSLNGICLPDETQHLARNLDEPRKLLPGRDDAGILYLTTPGSQAGKSGENLKITVPGEKPAKVNIKDVAHVCLFGNSQITTQALLALSARGASVCYFSYGGWLQAVTSPPVAKNISLRNQQFTRFHEPSFSLRLANGIVRAKIRNQRLILQRNGNCAKAVKELGRLANDAIACDNVDSVRGFEGMAAKIYWSEFPALLTPDEQLPKMSGRNRRPPQDPINAMLSYGYALLLRDWVAALTGVGFDPYFGFYHATVAGRPALALDMMEAFRPLVVDSTVLRAINEGVLQSKDFISAPGCSQFKPNGKKKFIGAYERRVDEMITHHIFNYRLSYRRMFYLESRLLSRVLEGELETYQPLETR